MVNRVLSFKVMILMGIEADGMCCLSRFFERAVRKYTNLVR